MSNPHETCISPLVSPEPSLDSPKTTPPKKKKNEKKKKNSQNNSSPYSKYMSHIWLRAAVFCIPLFDMHTRSQKSLGVLKSWTPDEISKVSYWNFEKVPLYKLMWFYLGHNGNRYILHIFSVFTYPILVARRPTWGIWWDLSSQVGDMVRVQTNLGWETVTVRWDDFLGREWYSQQDGCKKFDVT